jgi:SAM-dependent methyltransferase
LAEFTGERVVPGDVDGDLWNEHVARYAFAARLCNMKRVLDAGCGTGYGAAELARVASAVVGLDISEAAVEHAGKHYAMPNLRFLRASCTSMPLRGGSFDVVVAFEVIEHLKDWADFLHEIRRVLGPGGQTIISTPNSRYYGASRGGAGRNPYHEHEFTFEEFRDELRKVFPQVSLLLQNHAEGFVFQPVNTFSAPEARVESGGGGPEDSHFFVAVCGLSAHAGAPTFVYLPRAANILRERELHIEKLTKDLDELSQDRQKLLEMFRRQTGELEQRNRWAEQLNLRLEDAGAQIQQLQEELRTMATGYAAKVAALEEEGRKQAEWALDTERRVRECVDILHQTERTVEERTTWALKLQDEVGELEARLSRVRASRWVRLGKAIGVGPLARDS